VIRGLTSGVGEARNRLILIIAVVGVVTAGLVLRSCADDGDGAPDLPEGAHILDVPGVPFTLAYPKGFEAVDADKLPAGFHAVVGINPIDFIDVRLAATTELDQDALRAKLTAGLPLGQDLVSTDELRTHGVRFFVMRAQDSTGGVPTVSRLNFVHVGGETWEIGCQSQERNRARLDSACDLALRTFRERPGGASG